MVITSQSSVYIYVHINEHHSMIADVCRIFITPNKIESTLDGMFITANVRCTCRKRLSCREIPLWYTCISN